jgi:hypothetical protein
MEHLMIVVVDQNMMRSDDLRIMVATHADCRFIVPDAALEEMVKHEKWEPTMRGSFQILAPALDRVFVSAGIGELLRFERDERSAVSVEEILPGDLTAGARELVAAVLQEGQPLAAVRGKIESSRLEVSTERPSGDLLKARMLDSVSRLKSINGVELTAEIRNGRISGDARLGLLKLLTEALTEEFAGFDSDEQCLVEPWRLATTRFICATLWYHEHWLAAGGLHSAAPTTVANDAFDMEYAITASFFDDLLTKDRRAMRCAADLRVIASPNAEARLFQATKDHLNRR